MNSMKVSATESQSLIDALRPQLDKLQKAAIIPAVLGLIGLVIGAVTSSDKATLFQSYIYGYLFWFGLTMGSLAVLMLHQVVGAGAFYVIRRPLEAATRVIPIMFALFVPVFFGLAYIYPWLQPDYLASHPVVADKVKYLNAPGYIGRTIFCFIVWIIFAFFLNKWSQRQDQDISEEEGLLISNKLQMLGAGGLVAFAVTMTVTAIDFVMSMDPEWPSSLFGAHFVIGQVLTTLAGMILLVYLMAKKTDLLQRVPVKYYRDLGNFTLAFTLLWAYMSFSQYVIIYTGNIAEEVGWFIKRGRNGWQWIAASLIFIQFALPFLTLLTGSKIKKNPALLARVAVLILVMRCVDLLWITQPNYRAVLSVHLLDIAALLGIGGVWLYFFFGEMKKIKYLLPLNDVRFVNELTGGENAHGHSHGAHKAGEVAAHG